MELKPVKNSLAIIGGGPAGLMAAEAAVAEGARVNLYEAMASVGRKLLLAGKGGLNLTHAEPADAFLARYGPRRAHLEPLLAEFSPDALREWVHQLGIPTFIGTSGRVFPANLKAAPLLRAWLRRLRQAGVDFHVHHRWCGWEEERILRFAVPQGIHRVQADAVVLALGGASWSRFGSNGAWVALLENRGVPIIPLKPANCGFEVNWSHHLRTQFAGHPVKPVAVVVRTEEGKEFRQQGEFVVTESGIEGGVVYAVSARLRDEILEKGMATIWLDLTPDRDLPRLIKDLSQPRGARSFASILKRRIGLKGVKAGLLHEFVPKQDFYNPERLGNAIKSLPVSLVAPRPLEEAISTAGGVAFEALDSHLMIRQFPGVFCAGEMLDWEAPTGGYLLTACFASGRVAGIGAARWLHPSSMTEKPQRA